MTGHGAERPTPEGRFAGLHVPDPAFADDDGSADPGVRAALAAWASGAGSEAAAVAALAGARLLVPVVAVLDEAESRPDGLRHEKDSHMASVSLMSADGRRGLLAFTGLDALTNWDAAARPVAARAPEVAAAALQEGADALLLDVAGPTRRALAGRALAALAAGGAWPARHEDAQVRAAVAGVALAVPGVRRVRLDPGDDRVDVVAVVDVDPGRDPAGTLREVAEALAADSALADLLDHGVAVTAL